MRLAATWSRWTIGTGLLGAAFVAAVQAYLVFVHSDRPLASFGWLVAGTWVVLAVLTFAALRAEDARLAREIRMARTASAAVRAMVTRRKQSTSVLSRLFATRLGTAAVLLAEGDREGALDALAAGAWLMGGGRLAKLRQIVEADAERANGTSVDLERCVQRLRAMPPLGNREADLYRLHVLVKAVLEQGDSDTAVELVESLGSSKDDEERVYATWLRVWFDLDEDADYRVSASPLHEGDLRMAALLARAQGADKLVEKLDARIGSVARIGQG
jgi:hypothetical protein